MDVPAACRSSFSTNRLFFISVPASDITTLKICPYVTSTFLPRGSRDRESCVVRSVFQLFKRASRMPLKSRKRKHIEESLAKAREAKRRRELDEAATSSAEIEVRNERSETDSREDDLSRLVTMSEDALDTEDEAGDPTFDLDSSMKSDTDHIAETYCEEWLSQIDRDDRVDLGLFLCFQMTKHLEIKETRAAELAGLMIGKSDKTICEWKQFYVNDGVIPESQQGK